MTIYDRIKQLREAKGMSQSQLAKLCEYTNRSSIARIEAGDVDISLTKLDLFAKALGVSPMYLMGWEDEPDEVIDAEIHDLYESLPEDKQTQARQYLQFLNELNK